MYLLIGTVGVACVVSVAIARANASHRLRTQRLSEMAEALGDPRRCEWALDQLIRRKQHGAMIEALLAPPTLARDTPPPHTRMTRWDYRLARLHAVEGLGTIRAQESVNPLLTALAAANPVLRIRIVWALGIGSIGRCSAESALIAFLGDDDDVLAAFSGCRYAVCPDGVHTLGELAAWSLRQMDESQLVDAFEGTLRGDPAAVGQLKSLDAAGVRTALMRAVNHKNPIISANAALALAEFRATEALPNLRARLRALDSRSDLVRRTCAQSISQLEMLLLLPRVAAAPPPNTRTLPRVASSPRLDHSRLPRAVGQ